MTNLHLTKTEEELKQLYLDSVEQAATLWFSEGKNAVDCILNKTGDAKYEYESVLHSVSKRMNTPNLSADDLQFINNNLINWQSDIAKIIMKKIK